MVPSPRPFDLEVQVGGSDLFGRDNELSWLDAQWMEGAVPIVSLNGPAGIGKSALAKAWLEGTKKEKDRKTLPIRVWDDVESQPNLAEVLADLTNLGSPAREFLLIISREPLAELDRLPQQLVKRMQLGPLSPSAGRALLRVNGVRGSDAELEAISRELGGLPSALVRRAGG